MTTSKKKTTNSFTVYMHISPNGKRYIGITSKSMEQRWNNGNGYNHNAYFFDAIRKYGPKSFQHMILAKNLSKEQACKMEKELIKKYDTTNREKGYNHSTGGDISAFGVRRTPEYVEKLRQRHLGKNPSEETRRKISEKLKGKPSCRKGATMADISKKKTSKPVVCVETGKMYFGLNEAERQTGILSTNIGQCVLGKRERAGGLHWRRAS